MSQTDLDAERSSVLDSGRRHTNYNSINNSTEGNTLNTQVDGTQSNGSDGSGANSTAISEDASVSKSTSYRSWTRGQWMVLLTQSSLILTSCIAYPLLSTFFPQEASKKGVNSFTTGLIFGVYEFVIFLTSPIFGALIVRLTPRFMCLAGSFLSGGCCLLFGFLRWCPDGTIFIVMCFAVRILNAVGCSMAIVSNYAILSVTFPHHTAIVNGIAETITGIGFMLGPVVGAFLYDAGGFMVPFAVIGGLSLLSTVFAFFEPVNVYITETQKSSTVKVSRLLMNPGICLIYIWVFGASVALTFMDPIMSQWLEKNFTISISMVGLIYFIWSGMYAVSSPVMGKLTDKGFIYSVMIFGGILCFLALLCMGPSPVVQSLFPADKQLWIVCVTCVVIGVGCGAMFIPPYMAAVNLASVGGHELDTKVYGVISGLISSASSLGAFAGPTVAGYLNGAIGFEWSLTACAFLVLTVTLLMSVFCAIMKCNGRRLAPTGDDENSTASSTANGTTPNSTTHNNTTTNSSTTNSTTACTHKQPPSHLPCETEEVERLLRVNS